MKGNNELLRLLNMPVFSGVDELASFMHIDAGRLKMLTTYSDRYYRKYKIPKRTGGLREIKQPRKDLKAIQAWILRNILDRLSPSPHATAYIKKRSIADNVWPHSNSRFFICLDLKDFFPSISFRRVAKVFSLLGYPKRAAFTLANLCSCDGNLPQGAVTSPSLSNLIAAKLDRRIAGYTSRRNIIFTRYADDITLSSNSRNVLCQSIPTVLRIVKSEHFSPNMKKLRVLGPRRRCLVTGLVRNNSESGFGIGRKKKREMRAVMHHWVHKLGQDQKYKNEASIQGWLNYLKGVDEVSSCQMRDYWNKLRENSNQTSV